jgi:hypothetical protein
MKIKFHEERLPKINDPKQEVVELKLANGNKFKLGVIWLSGNTWLTKAFIDSDQTCYAMHTYSGSGVLCGVEYGDLKYHRLQGNAYFICFGFKPEDIAKGLGLLVKQGRVTELARKLTALVKAIEYPKEEQDGM